MAGMGKDVCGPARHHHAAEGGAPSLDVQPPAIKGWVNCACRSFKLGAVSLS